jgi:hypothetical protein
MVAVAVAEVLGVEVVVVLEVVLVVGSGAAELGELPPVRRRNP